MPDTSLFTERLKESRKNMGLSQAEISKICGVSRETWSRYESGKLSPGMEVLAVIALKGADIQYILTGIKGEQKNQLTLRQKMLLDNYEHTDDAGKGIIEATAFEAAKQNELKLSA